MKTALRLLPLLFIQVLLSSASVTTSSVYDPLQNTSYATLNTQSKVADGSLKLNFFQRLLLKLKGNKIAEDTTQGDKLASTSLWLGIGGIALFFAGFAFPYLFLASIPLGIAAMSTGKAAIRKGTQFEGKARTGKALGLGTLLAFAALTILAVVAISSINW